MSRRIVFFATAWGTRYGGINSFNFDICRALAKLARDKYEIICIVPRAEKGQIQVAKKKGVQLVELRYTGDEGCFIAEDIKEVKKLFPVSTKDEVLWWIGHDVHSGLIAKQVADETGMGKVAMFHHMGYESYLALIPINTQEPITKQREVLKQADIVFALGPKLAKSARDIVRASSNVGKVRELPPGLHNIKGLSPPEIFSAIVFGRLNKRTDCVKQAKLAVAGFSHACSSKKHDIPLKPDSSLMVIGLPHGDEGKCERKVLQAIAEKKAGREVQIHPWPYFEDRENLFEELRLKSICLVTSLYEGFGLVGSEAISAEVPLIISKNSGLFEFIEERFPGGRGCLESIDIEGSLKGDFSIKDVRKVAKKILKIRNNMGRAKKEAIALKAFMKPLCTWENCAFIFGKSLRIFTEEKQYEELCSEETEDRICRLFGFSKAQLHEMYNDIIRYYGF